MRYFIIGNQNLYNDKPNPKPEWLKNKVWFGIIDICDKFPNIFGKKFFDQFLENYEAWKQVFSQNNIQDILTHQLELPLEWDKKLSSF